MSWLSKKFKKITGIKLSSITAAAIGGLAGGGVGAILPSVWKTMSRGEQQQAIDRSNAEVLLKEQQQEQQQVAAQVAQMAAAPAGGMSTQTLMLIGGGAVVLLAVAYMVMSRGTR